MVECKKSRLYVVVRRQHYEIRPGQQTTRAGSVAFYATCDLLQQIPHVGEMSCSISLTFYLMLTAQDRRHLHFLKELGTHFFCEFKTIIQHYYLSK